VLAEVPEERLVGLVSVRGSRNSHLAIMARALGVPTVVGAEDLPYMRLDHQQVIVDGSVGEVVCNASEGLRQHYEKLHAEDLEIAAGLEELKDKPCESLDGHRLPLLVNTGLVSEVARSLDRGAEGVGLYRTEIPFLLRDRFPSEEEQRLIYREQLEAFYPKPVTMRTLDIGGDKALPYFPISEENPFLGWRGIRVTLDHPEIYLAQVRAMMKASADFGNLRIMLPMISNVMELEEALELIYRAHEELLEEGYKMSLPPVGVMVEVPAAVYQARELARRVDFLSVGSNDLTQYLLAVDRNNPRVADLYHSYHPAVLRALKMIVDAGHAEGKPVSICGELAGDPGAAVLLMAMGFDVLSMSAYNLPKVKAVIRQITKPQAVALLNSVLELEDNRDIEEKVNETLAKLGMSAPVRVKYSA
jgi:phosphotransferase system enzyme I (PtsP)